MLLIFLINPISKEAGKHMGHGRHVEVRRQCCGWSWFPPSTFTWVLGLKLGLSGFRGTCSATSQPIRMAFLNCTCVTFHY